MSRKCHAGKRFRRRDRDSPLSSDCFAIGDKFCSNFFVVVQPRMRNRTSCRSESFNSANQRSVGKVSGSAQSDVPPAVFPGIAMRQKATSTSGCLILHPARNLSIVFGNRRILWLGSDSLLPIELKCQGRRTAACSMRLPLCPNQQTFRLVATVKTSGVVIVRSSAKFSRNIRQL